MADTLKVSLKDTSYIPEYVEHEKERQTNEAQRQKNELDRIYSETERQNQEITRRNYYEELKQKVENGDFDGEDGKDGKDGVNGQDGEAGYTPVKGTDYFTETEKQEFVTEITNSVNQNIGLSLDTINGEEV